MTRAPFRSRLYFFELFTVANLAALLLFSRAARTHIGPTLLSIAGFASTLLLQAAAGLLVRSGIALARRDARYFRHVCRRRWIADTLRIAVAGAVTTFTYAWIKLVVPLEHPRLFDQELWNLDRLLFFGLSPNVFFLDLFSNDPFLRLIDTTYAMIFFASMTIGFAAVLSDPRRRVRIAFANGNAALWLTGAWLYMLVPSLGPAFRFPDLWFAHAAVLRRTQQFQSMLMRNYDDFLRLMAGRGARPVHIVFGIAAFPSLHVAFQTYVFLWMRRLWRSGEVLFGLFAVTIFLGSMLTGWHYMVDGLAGALLAAGCYRGAAGAGRFRQFRRHEARFDGHARNTD